MVIGFAVFAFLGYVVCLVPARRCHRDIGSFLGLTFETVSRTLSYFESKQWISIQRKRLAILDMSALEAQVRCAQ